MQNLWFISKAVKKHYSYQELRNHLTRKLVIGYKSEVDKDHIDNCRECWDLWNKVRWDVAEKSRGLLELKEYLGENFKEYYDSSWALADEWNKKNPLTKNDAADFYKNTKNYLFNLVIWHESGDRQNFHNDLLTIINKFSVKSVIDFGCGVGSDSLFLLENKIQSFMVDFNCPSTDFMKWRMQKRGLSGGKFIDIEKNKLLPKGEMFWAVDVLEHIFNPTSVVEMLSDRTKIFVHHSQFNKKSGGRHPFHIYFSEQKLNDSLRKKGFVNIPWNNMSVWVKKYI